MERMARIRALYSQPYWRAEEGIEELKSELGKTSPSYLISKCLVPALLLLRLKTARIESDIDGAKLTLGLHIYKNRHGMFPDKLEQLCPEILRQIPVDPITGNPFEYSKESGGSKFTLAWTWLKELQERDRKEQDLQRDRNKIGK